MKFLITFKQLPKKIEKGLLERRRLYFKTIVDNIHIYSDIEPRRMGEGLLFGFKIYPETEICFRDIINRDIIGIDKVFDGKYLYIDFKKKILFSDPLGLQPVFIGENAISSDRKSLWLIKEKGSYHLPPNRLWKIDERGIFSNNGILIRYNHKEKRNMSMEDAAQTLCEYLIMRMKHIASFVNKNVKKIYIAFSGGVDSSLTYILSKKAGLDPWLVTVAREKSHDLKASTSSVKLLDAENNHIVISLDENHLSMEDVREIIELIENPNLMQISLALPLYLIVKHYGRRSAVFMGQGSDELYGGYNKYMQLYKDGEEAVEKEIMRDVIFSYRFNFSREMKITDSMDSFLVYPLISPGIVKFVIQLPLQYKIISGNDEIRKWLIRKVAEKCLVPKEIVTRKKKSMQYSSGSQNIIINLLNKKKAEEKIYGYYLETVKKYVNNIHHHREVTGTDTKK